MELVFPSQRCDALRRDLEAHLARLEAAKTELAKFVDELRELQSGQVLFEQAEVAAAQDELDTVLGDIKHCKALFDEFTDMEKSLRSVLESRLDFFTRHEGMLASRKNLMAKYVESQTKLTKELQMELEELERKIRNELKN